MRDLVAVIKSVSIPPNCRGLVPFILLTRQIITVTTVTNPPVTVALKLLWCHVQMNMGPACRALATKPSLEGEVGKSTPAPRLLPHSSPCSAATETSPPPQQSGKALPQDNTQESLLLHCLSYHSSCPSTLPIR